MHTTGSMLRPGSWRASMIVTHTWKSCDFRWSLNLLRCALCFFDSWLCWLSPCWLWSALLSSSVFSSLSFSMSLSLEIIDWTLPACEMLSYGTVALSFRIPDPPAVASSSAISDLDKGVLGQKRTQSWIFSHLPSSSVLLSRSRSFDVCLERPIFIKFFTARNVTRLSDTAGVPLASWLCDFFMRKKGKHKNLIIPLHSA